MGTEILRPQDCLIERVRFSPCRRKTYYGNNYGNGIPNTSNTTSTSNHNNSLSFPNPNPKPYRKPAVRSERSASHDQQRQSEPLVSRRSSSAGDLKGWKNQNVAAMEKVTILRRGESLDSKIRSGPDPKTVVTKQNSKTVAAGDLRYAGSACCVSPDPSSLPLPSFSKKKQISFDDSATRDLRRLLRLDL